MVINHNIAALNTLSALQKNTAATQSSLQKLSTGSKINSASDDASGLAISQKMQAQINGLNQSQENVSNGNSLIQTAEGALGNVQDILQKMRTLANEAQNDTQNDTDKSNLQDQANALAQEINRISTQTAYNTKDVFGSTDGQGLFSNSGLQIQIGADSGQTIALSLSSTVTATSWSVNSNTANNVALATATNQASVTIGGTAYTVTFYASTQDAIEGTNAITANAVASASTDAYAKYATLTGPDGSVLQNSGSALVIDVTSTAETTGYNGTASIAVTTLNSATTNLAGVNVVDLGVGSGIGEAATAISLTGTNSINTIQSAIDTVSKLRSKLGAYQNRLTYAGDTLDIESQNLTSAESTLTDTDVAQEMMNYTKNNILVQSAQAMLAQANQLPQGMLSLLKS